MPIRLMIVSPTSSSSSPIMSGVLLFSVLCVCLALPSTFAFSWGAPGTSCVDGRPFHNGRREAKRGTGGFKVTHDICRGYYRHLKYDVVLSGVQPFTGFFCKSYRFNGGSATGTFLESSLPENTKLSACSFSSTGVTQSSKLEGVNVLRFKWRAPRRDRGTIKFTCTVIVDMNTHYTITSHPANPSQSFLRHTCPPAEVVLPFVPNREVVAPGACPQICPAGDRGQTGPRGDRGDVGRPGRDAPFHGSQGPKGFRGNRGAHFSLDQLRAVLSAQSNTISGERGDPGFPGLPGFPGNPGNFGPRGNPGAPGRKGSPGFSVWLDGLPGARGDIGDYGYGPPGFKGSQGEPGSPGVPGGRGVGEAVSSSQRAHEMNQAKRRLADLQVRVQSIEQECPSCTVEVEANKMLQMAEEKTRDLAQEKERLSNLLRNMQQTPAQPQPQINWCERCNHRMGVQDASRIRDSQIRGNSERPRRLASHARLNGISAWVPSKNMNSWIVVDLGSVLNVTAIATQGLHKRSNPSQWTKTFKVQYMHGHSWRSVMDSHDRELVCPGNFDGNSIVRCSLTNCRETLRTRYIRVHPQTWQRRVTLRLELYGCS